MSIRKNYPAHKITFITSSILSTLLFSINISFACGDVPDPRLDSSGYATWCACMGGTVDYSAGVGCVGATGQRSSSAISTGGHYQPPSSSRDLEREGRGRDEGARKIQAKRIRRATKQKWLDEEKKQKQIGLEEQTQRIFEENKSQALGHLKGIAGESLSFKTGVGSQFKLKSNWKEESVFKLKSLPTASAKNSTQISEKVWKQLGCGASISASAMKAAMPEDGSPIDIEEVKFLGEQAIKSLVGEALRVQCPETKSPSKPYGQIELSDSAPLVLFYKALHKSTQEQVQNIEHANLELNKYAKVKRTNHIEVDVLEKKIKQIKNQKDVRPNRGLGANDLKSVTSKKTIDSNEPTALALAIAALEKAQKAEAEAANKIESIMRKRAQALKKLTNNKQLFYKIEAAPNEAKELLNEFNKK
ncbi:MAG: hypothetical protein ACI9Y8_000859 [Candidatus Omnitrophota bacterium]|jgi:hypothetical protein